MKTRTALAALPILLPLVSLLACSNRNKAPAEAALQTADLAVRTMSDVAMKFAPEQKQALEQALADAHALAEKKDWAGARAAAEAIPEKARQVLVAANEKKSAVTGWSEVSYTVKEMVTALQARLAAVTQSKTLPPGVAQAKVDEARTAATEIEAALAAARTQAQSGDFSGALAKAQALKARAIEVMKSVGMM